MSPRAKLLAIAALFLAPIAASIVAYNLVSPQPTANHGELLLPPKAITPQPFGAVPSGRFEFAALRGKWVMVASDSGACPPSCRAKLLAMRQVRLALGRDAERVARVFVVDDLQAPAAQALAGFEGTAVALTPPGMSLPPGAANDRAHVYLVDPRGNVMMRWALDTPSKHLLADLKRLLKASQIG